MTHTPIESGHIKSVAYDGPGETIEVKFNNGDIWQYPCSGEHYAGFMNSESKGQYFHKHIKKAGGKKV